MPVSGGFDAKIAKAEAALAKITALAEQFSAAVELVAKTASVPNASEFDSENIRIQELLRLQNVQEADLACLVADLEDETDLSVAAFEDAGSRSDAKRFPMFFKSIFTGGKARRAHSQWRRGMSLSGHMQKLLANSEMLIGLIEKQRVFLESHAGSIEAGLVNVSKRRRLLMADLGATRTHIGKLCPLLRNMESRIAALSDRTERADLEAAYSKSTDEYGRLEAEEREFLSQSRMLERYMAILRAFAGSLNKKIAAQSVLIDKLAIDIGQRVLLYKAIEERPNKEAGRQGEVANLSGSARKSDAMAGKHVSRYLAMDAKNMLFAQGIQCCKKLADDAFARRYSAVLETRKSRLHGR